MVRPKKKEHPARENSHPTACHSNRMTLSPHDRNAPAICCTKHLCDSNTRPTPCACKVRTSVCPCAASRSSRHPCIDGRAHSNPPTIVFGVDILAPTSSHRQSMWRCHRMGASHVESLWPRVYLSAKCTPAVPRHTFFHR